MNKPKSNALLLISCIAFTAAILVYFRLKQQFINNPYFLYGFSSAIGVLSGLILISIASRIAHSAFGFSLKYKSMDQALSINTQDQLGVLIHLPSDELSKIDHKSNIVEIKAQHCLSTHASITYNRGIFPRHVQHSKLNGVSLLTDEEDINQAKGNNPLGLLITTKHNPLQTLEPNLLDYAIHLQGRGKLLIHLYHSENDLKKHSKEELRTILNNRVVNHGTDTVNTKQTVYDLTALRILQDVPEIDPQNSWSSTETGKVAIAFFSTFNPKDVLDTDTLSINLTAELKTKLRCILNHIKKNPSTREDQFKDRYREEILNKIKTTYFESSYDIHHYSCIWKNRLLNVNGGKMYTTGLLRGKIMNSNPVFKYICTLAAMNGHGNDKDNKMTNTFINRILQEYEPANLKPIMKHVNRKTGLINKSAINPTDDSYIKELVDKLFDQNEACTITELTMRARKHITDLCKQHVIPYITRTTEETLKVDNITFIPERKTTDAIPTLINSTASDTALQQARTS